MTHPSAWSDIQDPAHLFLALWRYTNEMKRSRLDAALGLPNAIRPQLEKALSSDDGAVAVVDVCDLLSHHWNDKADRMARLERAALALAVMRAIDTAMLSIHPRSIIPIGASSLVIPNWAQDLQDRRTFSGAYAQIDKFSLVARGPFARSARMQWEEATFLLTAQFAALKVIDQDLFREDGRPLEVRTLVVDHSPDLGVPPRLPRAGVEVVSFVPLADDEKDLRPAVTDDAGKFYLDVFKGSYDPAGRFMVAVDACRDSDIVVAPELTVEPTDLDKIGAALQAAAGPRPRLMVVGSGLVFDPPDDDRPYNEAAIINGNGTRLWKHRKVAAYGILQGTLDKLDPAKVLGVPSAEPLMERIHGGDQITIADIDSLGRVIVLICQDLQMGVVARLLEEFQNDWVLVPILDSGTSLQRWPAQRARDLASISSARFVIVSSLTMKHWLKKKYPGEPMGVAVGPAKINKAEWGKDAPAQETEISPESVTRRHGTVKWRSGTGWSSYSYSDLKRKP